MLHRIIKAVYLLHGKHWNDNLQDYICVKYQSINETYNKAARRHESTLAVFRLSEVLANAILKEEKAQSLIMFHDEIKLTVGAQRTTQEKVQYCLTAVGTSAG